jgi:hypothetical protein
MNWNISQLECKPQDGDLTNVVMTVHWQCSHSDGEHHGHVYSTHSLPAPEGNFIPYDQLTKEDVLGWLWANGIDKAGTEAAVLAQIETSKNPPITKPPLPWSNA